MKKNLFTVFAVLVVVSILLTACATATPAPVVAPTQVVYDADYAHKICGERLVDSFDPATGRVECAKGSIATSAPFLTATPGPTFVPVTPKTVGSIESLMIDANCPLVLPDVFSMKIDKSGDKITATANTCKLYINGGPVIGKEQKGGDPKRWIPGDVVWTFPIITKSDGTFSVMAHYEFLLDKNKKEMLPSDVVYVSSKDDYIYFKVVDEKATPVGGEDIGVLLTPQVTALVSGLIDWDQYAVMGWEKEPGLEAVEVLYMQTGVQKTQVMQKLPSQTGDFKVPEGYWLLCGGTDAQLRLGNGYVYEGSNGVYFALAPNTVIKTLNLTNGFCEIVSEADAQQEYAARVSQAISSKWAHSNVFKPRLWPDLTGVYSTPLDSDRP